MATPNLQKQANATPHCFGSGELISIWYSGKSTQVSGFPIQSLLIMTLETHCSSGRKTDIEGKRESERETKASFMFNRKRPELSEIAHIY